MKKELNVSLLQMQSRATHTPNIEKVRKAAFNAKGQDVLVLPEYSGLLNKNANEVKNILLPIAQIHLSRNVKMSRGITNFGFILVRRQ